MLNLHLACIIKMPEASFYPDITYKPVIGFVWVKPSENGTEELVIGFIVVIFV